MLSRLILAASLAVWLPPSCAPAFAQTAHDAGHAEHHDVYKTWRIPGTNASCCNEKKTVDGNTTGDCYQTAAELRPSADPAIKGAVWWARLDTGQWVEIPDNRIIREPNPDPTGESGSLCYSDVGDAVLCFRPPVTGY